MIVDGFAIFLMVCLVAAVIDFAMKILFPNFWTDD